MWGCRLNFHPPSLRERRRRRTIRERKKRFAVSLLGCSSSDRLLLNCSKPQRDSSYCSNRIWRFGVWNLEFWNLNQWRRRWRCRGRVQLTPAHRPRRICPSLRRVSTLFVLKGSTLTPMSSPSALSTIRYDSVFSLSFFGKWWKLQAQILSIVIVLCSISHHP